MNKLFIFGDTHAEWKAFNIILNKLCQKHKENIDIIVAGDFGYWPNEKEYDLKLIKTFDDQVKIYFCPGNHEDWFSLEKFGDGITEIYKNIFYCSFGTIKSFNNKNFMFCGGADSIDKNYRKMGIDWFPQEVITSTDLYKLPDSKDVDVDVMISHTCPEFCSKQLMNRDKFSYPDPSRKSLDHIHNYYKPPVWFFAHFHKYMKFFEKNTWFTCLNMLKGNNGTCFVELYK